MQRYTTNYTTTIQLYATRSVPDQAGSLEKQGSVSHSDDASEHRPFSILKSPFRYLDVHHLRGSFLREIHLLKVHQMNFISQPIRLTGYSLANSSDPSERPIRLIRRTEFAGPSQSSD